MLVFTIKAKGLMLQLPLPQDRDITLLEFRRRVNGLIQGATVTAQLV